MPQFTFPRVRLRTWGIPAATMVAGAGIGVGAMALWGPAGTDTAEAMGRGAMAGDGTQTVTVALQTLEETVDATGSLAAVTSATLAFEASGEVTAVNVEEGDTVAEGDVIAEIDTLALTASLRAAEADLAVAQQQLEYASLTAPVAGTIVAVGFAAGDDVTAGDTAAVITLVADNSYVVNLAVSLTEAQLLAAGQDAQVTLTSTGDVVAGTVSSVSHVNTGNAYQQSYAVSVAVPDPGFDIRIGAATRMVITVAASTDVLVVPTSAVSDAAGAATVRIVNEDGTPSEASIETGAIGTEYTEVLSGLEPGSQVVLADLTASLTDSEEAEESSGLLGGLDSGSDDSGEFQTPDGFTPPGGGGGGGFQPPTMNG